MRKDNNNYNQNLNDAIDRIKVLCRDDWEVVLDYIENQRMKRVRDDIPDNVVARWAFFSSQVDRILLRLRQIKNKEEGD